MKKILYSILIAGSVGGLAFGATQAFFSDRETSPGNTFQAGKVDLTIDSTAHYDGMVCQLGDHDDESQTPDTYAWVSDGSVNPVPRPELLDLPCEGTWPMGTLVSEKFWNLSDVKPGDWGENTISMHVEDNPVWACIDIENMQNNENDRIDPEVEEGDATDGPQGGELAQNLMFSAWLDQGVTPGFQGRERDPGEGDNVWDGPNAEPLLFTDPFFGPASDVLDGRTYTLADGGTGVPLPGGTTEYIGLQWCAGQMAIVGDLLVCDGSAMGNNTQTDSLTADVTFRVEQSRNNPGFRCVPLLTPTPTPGGTGG